MHNAKPRVNRVARQATPEREEDPMPRKVLTTWVLLLVASALLLAATVGCGGDSSSPDTAASTSAAPVADLTAQQIVEQSAEKMKDVKSGSFTAELALELQGDPAKMTDPTQKAMLSQGLTLRADGKSSTDPVAVETRLDVGIAGQNLDFGLIAAGDKAWVQYQGKYYKVDQKDSKGLSETAADSLSPMDQLKKQGLDPEAWDIQYELVDTVALEGVQVYHVKGTVDTKAMARDLLKQLEDPDLGKQLGDPATAEQLQQGLAENKKQVEALTDGVREATADYWFEVDTLYLRKAAWRVVLDTKGQKDMEGIDGMTLKAAMTMSGFGEPVTVKPPAKALPFDKLMNEMFGGLMSGGLGASF